jgi:hypothetical protein
VPEVCYGLPEDPDQESLEMVCNIVVKREDSLVMCRFNMKRWRSQNSRMVISPFEKKLKKQKYVELQDPKRHARNCQKTLIGN